MNYKMLEGVTREETIYPGFYKYMAPDGLRFWVGDSCYGSVIWDNDELGNLYYLK